MSKATLMQRLLDAGYPREQMYHHESDLYVFVTPLTTEIIEKWYKEHRFSRTWHCPTFKDHVTGKQMYDCAFAYDPYWIRIEEVYFNEGGK